MEETNLSQEDIYTVFLNFGTHAWLLFYIIQLFQVFVIDTNGTLQGYN